MDLVLTLVFLVLADPVERARGQLVARGDGRGVPELRTGVGGGRTPSLHTLHEVHEPFHL